MSKEFNAAEYTVEWTDNDIKECAEGWISVEDQRQIEEMCISGLIASGKPPENPELAEQMIRLRIVATKDELMSYCQKKAQEVEIKSFWVVTKPTLYSTVRDICFESTPQKIGLQFLGGLAGSDVVGFYTCGDQAESLAGNLIDEYKYLKDEYKRSERHPTPADEV